MSTRSLAAAAGIRASAIHYHFGNLGHLFKCAQEAARQEAARWCEARLAQIGHDVRGSGAIGPLMAALVDDWCEGQRPLAFAWRECHVAALRDPAGAGPILAWRRLWEMFWGELCSRLDMADMARETLWLFESTSLFHLQRWRRIIDSAALIELCNGWADWIAGRPGQGAPVFEAARREVAGLIPPTPPADPVRTAMAIAAAQIVGRKGLAGLTHRAVALAAGLSLGMVAYRFRTTADLLQAAFETIYLRSAGRDEDLPAIARRAGGAGALGELDAQSLPRADMIALEELLLAAARDPALADLGAAQRYTRGRSGLPLLQAVIGARAAGPIDGAIFSGLLHGRLRAHAIAGQQPAAGAAAADLGPILARVTRA